MARRLALGLLLAVPALYAGASNAGETLRFGRFGTVTLYQGSPAPSRVVLFVSGDGGWNRGVVDMAKELATLDTLVIGIDIRSYLKNLEASSEKCSYPAGDFEALSQFVQKKLDLPRYVQPVLCGYSSGATLVYAVLVQAPTGTFRGAISLGFCPDLPLVKPFCRGQGLAWKPGAKGKGSIFEPSADLESPWVALQGTIDVVCDPVATEKYAKEVRGARVVTLPKVGHGFSVPRNWMPQLRDELVRITHEGAGSPAVIPRETRAGGPAADAAGPSGARTAGLDDGAGGAGDASSPGPVTAGLPAAPTDLPLIEVPAAAHGGRTLAVIVSGDGGWAGLDREVSRILASRGVPVVGLNSLQYFWKRRTPEGAAADLERMLRHYLPAWGCEKALLIGYSRGADVLPFMAGRLPADLLSRVSLVALLGPAHTVDFQFHLSDWLGGSSPDNALPVLPEVKRLGGVKVLCLYGEDESDTICPEIDAGAGKAVRMQGGHHFGRDYSAIASSLIEEAGQ